MKLALLREMAGERAYMKLALVSFGVRIAKGPQADCEEGGGGVRTNMKAKGHKQCDLKSNRYWFVYLM